MKVLAASAVFPESQNVITMAYAKFFSSLRSRTDCEESWVVFQPDKFRSYSKNGRSVTDIHDYTDAVSLLEGIRPDCILVGSMDFVSSSLTAAAIHLGIPSFLVHTGMIGKTPDESMLSRLRYMFRNLFLNKTQGDHESDKKFMRKGRHIAYKITFFYHTLLMTRTNPLASLATVCREIGLIMLGKLNRYSTVQDAHFVVSDLTISDLVNWGINKDDIFLTKSIIWDDLINLNDIQITKKGKDLVDVLVMTCPFYEHGVWSRAKRDTFVAKLASSLGKDPGLRISFKVHPSSEDIRQYEDLLDSPAIKFHQSEKISDIIGRFDVAISYGPTGAQTEAVAAGIRLVRIYIEEAKMVPLLIDEGLKSGIVTMCDSPELAARAVRDSLGKKISLTDGFLKERDALFSESDADKISDVILGVLAKSGNRGRKA